MISTVKAVVRWWWGNASPAPLGEASPSNSLPDTLVPALSNRPTAARTAATPAVMTTAPAPAAVTTAPVHDGPCPEAPGPSAADAGSMRSQAAGQDVAVRDHSDASGAHIKLMRLSSLTALPKFVKGDSAVFFDVDETLVRRGVPGQERDVELTQSDTALVVKQLQGRENVCVFGLTARPYIVGKRLSAARTRRELLKLGIDFGRSAQVYPRVRHQSPLVGFCSGCAYTGGLISKGDMLGHLVNQVPMHSLVFVDDLPDNLHSVATFAASAQIPCLAVHYTGGLGSLGALEHGLTWAELCTTWCRMGASVVLAKQG